MKKATYNLFALFVILITSFGFAQQYSGPAQGNVESGIIVTTDDFAMPVGEEQTGERKIIEVEDPDFGTLIAPPSGEVYDNYVYVDDKNVSSSPTGGGVGTSFELNSFSSIPMTNSIPPDPHMALGPNHVIAMVNSRFYIYDRDGNVLKNISADAWCGQVLPNPGAFDPQIIYDHYEGRWFMLWDNQNDGTQTAFFLIAFSDDEDPLGTWYMYAVDATTNGNTHTNSWGDYPQLGYDDQAIYIMSRQFTFSGSYNYNKIRIINKAELYAANENGFTWQDIWNIKDPDNPSNALDVIHPVISYDTGLNRSYFVWANRQGANYYVLYWIDDPIGSPTLSGVRITVPFYGQAPLADQLGGGDPRIESGGSSIRNAPILRDGKIYAVHAIRNSQFSQNGSLKYFVLDANTHAVLEQVEQGAEGYYYIYPAITVDMNHNLAICYSRSADTEYIGAFYSTKLGTDPPGLSPSKVMMEGQGNYVVTFGSSRNRWGDYLMAALDPSNQTNIYLYSEYAADEDMWGTWLTEIRMVPFMSVYPFAATSTIDFGNVEVGTTSDPITLILSNYGEQDWVINNIPSSVGDFTLETPLTFPVTISTYDSLLLDFTFSPSDTGDFSEVFQFTSNDPGFTELTVMGHGYTIAPAFDRTLYASSGPLNDGNILVIDRNTGEGTNIGPSRFFDISGLAINPNNNEIYAVRSNASESQILRVNALGGDAYVLFNFDFGDLVSIAFDTSGALYGLKQSGEIYSIDLATGDYTLVSTAPIELLAIAFEPGSNQLWATVPFIFGTQKDRVYKIDLATGDTTRVGVTGLNTTTNAIVFDDMGVLYGTIGSGSTVSDLIIIDPDSATGTVVGSIGVQGVTGLAFEETGIINAVEEDNENTSIPTEFVLSQNYPNPFNPSTRINFSVPEESHVTITIYNLLGEVVTSLVNENIAPGNYNVTWNGTDNNGFKVSSGIYLYELKATGNNGSNFMNTKKMILLK